MIFNLPRSQALAWRMHTESVQETKYQDSKSLRGIFNQYADNSKLDLEDNVWQNYIVDKYKI